MLKFSPEGNFIVYLGRSHTIWIQIILKIRATLEYTAKAKNFGLFYCSEACFDWMSKR